VSPSTTGWPELHGSRSPQRTAWLRYEAPPEQRLFADGEAAEGIRAFIAKRPPYFA